MGKGDRERMSDRDKYEKSYDRIFKNEKEKKCCAVNKCKCKNKVKDVVDRLMNQWET